ncbi:MAG: ArsI/CadI family heavy metal resistance metalloenzyme [Gammaproteobacteria bacterium]
MKRLHVHVAVADLDRSIRFYSTLFGSEPTVSKPDYAKWLLDDPRVNFAISGRAHTPGINHLGIQVDSREALEEITARLHAAEAATQEQEAASCCYARSHKTWSEDPQGVSWETFYTYGEATVYGDDDRDASEPRLTGSASTQTASACCRPAA